MELPKDLCYSDEHMVKQVEETCYLCSFSLFKKTIKSTNEILIHGIDFEFTGKIKYSYSHIYREVEIDLEIEYYETHKQLALTTKPPFITIKSIKSKHRDFFNEEFFHFAPGFILLNNGEVIYDCNS